MFYLAAECSSITCIVKCVSKSIHSSISVTFM